MIQLGTPPQQRCDGQLADQATWSDGNGSQGGGSTSKNMTNKRTRSVSPERTAKRPHLCLSRKLSYSSALLDAPASVHAAASTPPSPGFPSVLAVASSLASSLRAGSSLCNSDAMPEDHLGSLPQDLRSPTKSTPTCFAIPSASSGRRPIESTTKRIAALRRSLVSCESDVASTSQAVLEDFLFPRPGTSRASSSDSWYRDLYIRTDSEGPDSEAHTSCGLVAAADDWSDGMDEDFVADATLVRTRGGAPSESEATYQKLPRQQKTLPHDNTSMLRRSSSHPAAGGLDTSSGQDNSSISGIDRNTIARSLLFPPSRESKAAGGFRYSMGIKKGCRKCESGDHGHFTHLDLE